MGYTITIGNAEPKFSKDDGDLCAKWSVPLVRHDEAPAFGDPTDHENQRWPSYSAWAESMSALGLYDLFLARDEGLMSPHPGCKLITAEHLEQVRSAVAKRSVTNGGKPAGFFGYDTRTHTQLDNGNDPDLARGVWLEYWMDWALKNCETPAIENS